MCVTAFVFAAVKATAHHRLPSSVAIVLIICGTGPTLIRPKTKGEVEKDKSHKHHEITESMVSGGDLKRELVPPGGQQ
jgi:hypothetical protein